MVLTVWGDILLQKEDSKIFCLAEWLCKTENHECFPTTAPPRAKVFHLHFQTCYSAPLLKTVCQVSVVTASPLSSCPLLAQIPFIRNVICKRAKAIFIKFTQANMFPTLLLRSTLGRLREQLTLSSNQYHSI